MRIIGKSKKHIIDKDLEEIFTAEIVSITIGIMAGLFLIKVVEKLYLVPALLILLPGFLELKGNIVGSLGARLGTALHTKKIKIGISDFLKQSIIADIFLAVFTSLILGVIAFFATYLIFGIKNPGIILISLLAAVLAIVITIPLTILGTFWLYKHGYDPDDIMGPYITSVGDIVSVIALYIAIILI